MAYDHAQLNYTALGLTLPNFKIWNIHVSNVNTVKGSGWGGTVRELWVTNKENRDLFIHGYVTEKEAKNGKINYSLQSTQL